MNARAAVTGMGTVNSIGKNVREFAESLRLGRCGIGRLKSAAEPPISVEIGAEIMEFSLETMFRQYKHNGFPGDFQRYLMICTHDAPLGVKLSVLSALEAWTRAQLPGKPINPHRLAVITAGSNLSQNYHYGLLSGFRAAPRYLAPKYAIHYMDTDHVGTLSDIFKIRGEGFTVGGSSASGNVAVLKGFQLICQGTADACLVVGALADLSPLELQGFYNVGAMGGKRFHHQPGKACRPFDKDHEGFIYGQGCGALILESLTSVEKRGIPVLAEMLAGSLVLDGNRLPNPNEHGEARVMASALKQAGIKPGDINYLNAHGTSSPIGDETEIKAIKQVFKEYISNIWINSTKGLTGHCLTAAGVVETIALIIQMQEGFVHPNLNLDNPIDDECRFCPKESLPVPLNISMNNSFGFGGINTCLIFKNPKK